MLRPIQLFARECVFPTISALRLQKLLWKDHGKIQVLMYHGVNATGDTSINGRHISAKRFEKHLIYLHRNFEVLSLADSFLQVGHPANGKPRVAITFDDGFENNLIYAAPLLKKYNLPATFFISSICVTGEADILWADVVDLVLRGNDSVTAGGLDFVKSSLGCFNEKLGKTLQQHIKEQDCEERDAIILELSERYNLESKKQAINPENWKMMTPKQLKELSKFPEVEIGSHCHNHYNLASLSEENALDELKKSKKLLEDCIEKPVTSVAFPDGSYSERVKQQAKDVGYDKLCAVTFKLADDQNDRTIVRRSSVSATTNYYSNIIHFHKLFKKDGN